MAEYRHLATPHPQWADVNHTLPLSPSTPSIQASMTNNTSKFPNNLPPNTNRIPMTRDHFPITPQKGLEIEEFHVPARDNHPICIRSYKQSYQKDLPLLIYLHGGGFVTGGLETDDNSCRVLAAQLPLLVLNVEYRLAPENKFPVGFGDCFDVVRWVSDVAILAIFRWLESCWETLSRR
jgi:acetyl esterase/lipase